MKKLKSSAEFDQIIREYKENPNVDTMGTAFECLWILAHNILKAVQFTGIEKAFRDKTNTLSRLIAYAFIKIERCDPDKGRAFNFFTTIMLGWLRQEYRTIHKYAELKEKYNKYAEENRDSSNRKQRVYRHR